LAQDWQLVRNLIQIYEKFERIVVLCFQKNTEFSLALHQAMEDNINVEMNVGVSFRSH